MKKKLDFAKRKKSGFCEMNQLPETLLIAYCLRSVKLLLDQNITHRLQCVLISWHNQERDKGMAYPFEYTHSLPE